MPLTIDLAPAKNIQKALDRLSNLDATPLAEILRGVMEEDNRRGVMAGLQGDGTPMPRTTYRMSLVSANPNQAAQLGELGPGYERMDAGNFGSSLTTKEYKSMSGPPLAPRGERSRVISNYATRQERIGMSWAIEGAWLDVLSRNGTPFLHAHFVGLHATFFGTNGGRHTVNLPRRNLVGLREWGRTEARNQINAWAKIQIAESILSRTL